MYEGAKIMLKFDGASSWRDIKDYFRRGRGQNMGENMGENMVFVLIFRLLL